jgi:carboxyl-terminal processing protease
MRRLFAVLLTTILCGAALSACTTTEIPHTGIPLPVPDLSKVPFLPDMPFLKIPLFSRGDDDYRDRGWAKAFETMHLRLVREYPFTKHKAIDWNLLYKEFSKAITEAEKAGDETAYYLALRRYMYSIPDGNMRISDNDELRDAAIGGGFGFTMMPLEDGRFIATRVINGQPAMLAGMEWGAEIQQWNGRPVREVLKEAPVMWAMAPAATNGMLLRNQCRFLTRAPIGEEAVVIFQNPGSETPWVARMNAAEDSYATLQRPFFLSDEVLSLESPVTGRMLEDGRTGCIRIYFEAPTLATPFPMRAFRKALQKIMAVDARGLVLDVRGNTGGDRELLAKFLGCFVREPVLLEEVALFNPATGDFEINPETRTIITPDEIYCNLPLIVLVNQWTFGSGEGFPLILKKLPRVKIMGFHATHGTFGITGGDIIMPEGITLSYPVGRSLDAEGNIQVDSDNTGKGGIAPDIRVPMNYETAEARFRKKHDVLIEKAVAALEEMDAAAAS